MLRKNLPWFCVIFICLTQAGRLRKGALNVCSDSKYVQSVREKYPHLERERTCCDIIMIVKGYCLNPCYRYVKWSQYRMVLPEYNFCCPGWMHDKGDSCTKPICDPPCEKGVCIRPNKCKCDREYGGDRCNLPCLQWIPKIENSTNEGECILPTEKINELNVTSTLNILQNITINGTDGVNIAPHVADSWVLVFIIALVVIFIIGVLGVGLACLRKKCFSARLHTENKTEIEPRPEEMTVTHIYESIPDLYQATIDIQQHAIYKDI